MIPVPRHASCHAIPCPCHAISRYAATPFTSLIIVRTHCASFFIYPSITQTVRVRAARNRVRSPPGTTIHRRIDTWIDARYTQDRSSMLRHPSDSVQRAQTVDHATTIHPFVHSFIRDMLLLLRCVIIRNTGCFGSEPLDSRHNPAQFLKLSSPTPKSMNLLPSVSGIRISPEFRDSVLRSLTPPRLASFPPPMIPGVPALIRKMPLPHSSHRLKKASPPSRAKQ